MRVDSKEFIQLVEDANITLSKERGHVGSLRIKGKLVYLPAEGNAVIVSDLHGDMESLLHILRSSEFIKKVCEGENVFIIFLGDYGDRGVYSPEVYYVVLRLKISFPENVVLIDERYVMLHGGVPSKASTIDDIAYAHKKHPQETHLDTLFSRHPCSGHGRP